MIEFNYETSFTVKDETKISDWIVRVVSDKGFEISEVNYIFCDDVYLHKLNVEFLQHDTLTDVISFDNTMGKMLGGDIFISVERVKENADEFKVSFEEELYRVMIHGVLHFIGLKDKTIDEVREMRRQEEWALSILNN